MAVSIPNRSPVVFTGTAAVASNDDKDERLLTSGGSGRRHGSVRACDVAVAHRRALLVTNASARLAARHPGPDLDTDKI